MDTLLSIITMYNWDNTLFDNMAIPPELDKDLLVDNLMLELGELELLYNDPDMMKFAIGRWSNKELKKWNDLYATTNLTYDPIENYNRTDTFTDTETRDLTRNNTQTKDLTNGENETRDLTTGVFGDSETEDVEARSGGDSTTKFVKGYNNLDETQSDKEVQQLNSKNTKEVATKTSQTGKDTGTVDKSMTETGTITDAETDAGTVTINKSGNSSGNIGVTSTQQLIEQQRGVVEFNIYEYIIESFKMRFCILVY